MAAGLLGLGIATSVIGGISDIVIGGINAKAAKNTAEFNATRATNTADFNAKMTGLEGRMYKLSAQQEIETIRKKATSLLSVQRAGYARAGFALEGSPIAVMTKSQEEAELDVIYANINMEYGESIYSTQAGIQRAAGASEAGIQRMAGKAAASDFKMSAARTILNTGSSVYKQYQLSKLYDK